MRITRTDPLLGPLVEVELAALDQMERALKGLYTQDIDSQGIRSVLRQLVEGPLLSNARALARKVEPGEVPGREGEVLASLSYRERNPARAVTTYPAVEAALARLHADGLGLIRLEDGDLLEGERAREAIREAIIAAVNDCDEGEEF